MISCNEYDCIELVCMYRYPITLTMKTGKTIDCIALDTKYNDEREECIKADVEGAKVLIPLDGLSSLEVRIENPHFQRISFT